MPEQSKTRKIITVFLATLLGIQLSFIGYNLYIIEARIPNEGIIRFDVRKTEAGRTYSIDCYAKETPIFSVTTKEGKIQEATLNGYHYTKEELELD